MKKTALAPGQTLHGFTVERIVPLAELDSTGVSLVHQKTGLKLFHMSNDDNENAFAFTFRTPPADSNGVAHILEHSVLCGSEHFPLKDPFVVLLKGSLHTYLNAWTYPDKTVYPAASVNRADYFNILHVYGDAVFFPLLRSETFAQEAHHLEPADPAAPDGKLTASGVVYSEMKGNYSSQRSIVSEWTFRSLFPDTPYGLDSGGEPAAILTLTHAGLKEFHRRYYHPSNCRVLLYGDIPTEEQLAFLEERFLSRFDRLAVDSAVPLQKPKDRPLRLEKSYPANAGEDKARKTEITLAWLLPEVTDAQARTAFLIIAEALAGHAGSPLRRALVESGLGQDYSSAAGFETELRQMVFSTGLRGTDPAAAGKIEETASAVFKRLVADGIPADLVAAALHQIEFGAREVSGGSTPYPLRLFSRALAAWLHDAAPEETLLVLPALENVKHSLKDTPRFLEMLIVRHLIHNTHRSLVITSPDPEYMNKFEAEIDARVAKIEAGLSPAERAGVAEELVRLKEFQAKPDAEADVRKIPFLKRADLPTRVATIECDSETLPGGIAFSATPMFTNGIVYLDLAFRVDRLPDRFLPWLPLFSRAVTGSGLPGKSYADVQQELSLLSGGFSGHLDAGLMPGTERTRGYLFFRLKALEAKFPAALALALSLLREADFSDAARLRDIILESRNGLASSIVPRGSYHALLRAGRLWTPALKLQETWEGISQHVFLSDLSAGLAAGKQDPAAALTELRGALLANAPAAFNLTASRETIQSLKSRVVEAMRGLAGGDGNQNETAPRALVSGTQSEALLAAMGVSFTARVFPSAPFGTRESIAEAALGHILDTGLLHEKVRVQGGAYGAMSFPYRQEGVFCFGSYRDPRIADTLAAFGDCLKAAADRPTGEDDLVKTIISLVGREEQPLRPNEKGYTAFRRRLFGIADELRQKNREHLLALAPADLAARAARLLDLYAQASTVVLTGKDGWDKIKSDHPDWRFTETEISL